MTQDRLFKIVAGIGRTFRTTCDVARNNASEYIESNIIKGKYVTRDEYDQLRALVLDLNKQISILKNDKEQYNEDKKV